jgi:hypothetical protein
MLANGPDKGMFSLCQTIKIFETDNKESLCLQS